MTPWHLAAESGHIKKMDYLFDKGTDINIQDAEGVILNDQIEFELVSISGNWPIAIRTKRVWFKLNLRELLYFCFHTKSLLDELRSWYMPFVVGSEMDEYKFKVTIRSTWKCGDLPELFYYTNECQF